MAILKQQGESSNGFDTEELAPEGDYVATCIDIQDEFGVTRRKFQSEETEEIDVTRFLFGFKGKDGKLYKVQTWEMKISGSPKSGTSVPHSTSRSSGNVTPQSDTWSTKIV